MNQVNFLEHIRECLDLINVDRIDHGYNCLEDDDLVQEIVSRGLGLTICPISNRMVIQSLTGAEIKKMLDHGIKATINSDDPAYFRAYLNDNFIALAEEGELTKEEIVQLSRNAFDIAWLPDSRRQNYIDLLNEFTSN